MVKKLLKYEFISLSKPLIPMGIILLCSALFTRIVQFFESSGTTYKILIYSSSILLGLSMIVAIVMTVAVCVIRFYKNMFTAEGYLTLTLPVTHTEHILSKLISAVISSVVSLIAVIAALFIATAGDVSLEIFKAIKYLIKIAARFLDYNFYLYSLEIILSVIAFTVFVYLLLYTCLTVGQMAKKNRILAAFGVYFGWYVFRQIIGTIFIIVFVTCQKKPFMQAFFNFSEKNPYAFFHMVFCFIFVLFAGLAVAAFFITKNVLKHKLNIE